jgi:hypothetical protein
MILKKMMLLICLGGSFLLSACGGAGTNDYGNESQNDKTIQPINSPAELDDPNIPQDTDDFGYSRKQRSLTNEQMPAEEAPYDRRKISNIITRIALQTPDVKDVSTLVTDEEVLIVYDTDTDNRFETADQIKKAALNVVPRYYHVYVSDDTTLRDSIERYQDIEGRANIENSIDGVIKEMKKSPQGRKISNGENPNGEQEGEMNEDVNTDETENE